MSPVSSTNRVSGWEWAQTVLLAGNLVWTTLCLGGYRPETLVVTIALTGLLVAVHALSRVFAPRPRLHPAGWLFVPFLVYAAISARWITPVPWLGWRDWLWWANMLAVFWVGLNGVRSPAAQRRLFGVLVALGLAATAMACYQHFVQPRWMMLGRVQADQFSDRASGCFGIPNSLGAFLLLLIPATAALAFRPSVKISVRVAWGIACGLLVYGLVLTISRGAWIGLALALIGWPCFALRATWRQRAGVALAALVACVMVGGALYAVSASIRSRLNGLVHDRGEVTRPILWRAAWRIFREQPATGSGAGSYNVRFEKYRPEKFSNEPQWAHNDYLNTLSDYGLIGFGLFFGACGLVAWRCVRGRGTAGEVAAPVDWLDSRVTRAALATGLLAFALQLFVDFHFKIPALAMSFALLAAVIVARCWPVENMRRLARWAPIVSATAAVLVMAGLWRWVMPRLEAEALRGSARQRIDELVGEPVDSARYVSQLEASRVELERAVVRDPHNAQAWADLAYVSALRGHIRPQEVAALGRVAEEAASRALALAPECVEFWVRRGVARDMQGRWLEGSLDFGKATTLAPGTAWVWFYYADHMSRKTSERGLMEAALALCLRLDPQNQDALALRQRLAISH